MMSRFDLVVIEATPAGVAMAVRAAVEGLQVLLATRGRHLGGMLSSGLGVWDTRWEGRRAPVYDEVRRRILAYYHDRYGFDSSQYSCASPSDDEHGNGRFEPNVAQQVIEEFVAEAGVTVWRECTPIRCRVTDRLIATVEFDVGGAHGSREVAARFFADCTYEGDFAALARVPWRIGRESADEFNEPHAGRIFLRSTETPQPRRRPKLRLRAFTGEQEVMLAPGSGRADPNVQAFNYRTILSSDPINRVSVKPDPMFRSVRYEELDYDSTIEPLPNQKLSWNRPQLPGRATAYVLGDAATRQRMADEHWEATLGLLDYLQHDPAVPESVRRRWSRLGLAADEFRDHGHRPYELYVREGRRIDGRARLTERDLLPAEGYDRAPVQPDAIAATEWYIDVHACGTERVGDSLPEGKMMLWHDTVPGQVPYGTLLPAALDNLIVPVALSATHVAFSAVRVEPTWMALGEAAAWAVVLAAKKEVVLPALPTDELQRQLAAAGVMLTFFNDVEPATAADQAAVAAQFFGSKGFFAGYDARLGEPLSAAVAKGWRDGLAGLSNGELNASTLARAVAAAEREPAPAVPAMTRGEALVALWEQAGGPWPAAPAKLTRAASPAVCLQPQLSS